MSSGRQNNRVVFENDSLRVTRRVNKGRDNPARVKIEMLKTVGREPHPWARRTLDITLDELFDLTEVLDDLCDDIEDHG